MSDEEIESVLAVREAVNGVTAQWGRPYWRECAAKGRRPAEFMHAMATAGLLGLGVPEELGGSGGGITELVALGEALGLAGVPLSGYVVVPLFSRVPIVKYGTPEQLELAVNPTLTGDPSIAFAFTEPDSGTNTFAMRTKAERTEKGWLINGQKTYISGAEESTSMLVAARTGPVDGRAKLTLFVMPTDTPGVSMTRLSIRVNEPEAQYAVFFDDVAVPDSAVLGEPEMGARYLFEGLNPERLVAAAATIGLGEFALAKGVEYARRRAPFGVPIGSYQAVAHPMARAKVGLEAARLFTHKGAAVCDAGGDAGALSNMAKLLASESAWAAADATMQALGGAAFDSENEVLQLLPSLRLTRIAPINNEMILNYVSSTILGLPRSY